MTQQLTVDEAMQVAHGHRAGGRLAEAEGIYRLVLDQVPNHPDALQSLGRLLHGQGRRDEAIVTLGRLAALWPDSAEAQNNLGVALRGAGRIVEAIAACRRAIALRPDYAPAYNNLGNALRDAGQLDLAVATFDGAVALEPGSAEAHNNRGVALHEAGRRDEAIAAFDQAIALRPDYARAFDNLGSALAAAHRLDEAVAAHQRAIALRPGFAQAYSNLGKALRRLGQFDTAIAACLQAIALQPASASSFNNLANALQESGRVDDAIAACHRALALEPDNAEAHGTLGSALIDAGRIDEAIASLGRALEREPDSGAHYTNLGVARYEAGQSDLALACFRRAAVLDPADAVAASNVLFTAHCLPALDAAMLLAEHRRWAAHFAAPLAAQIAPHPNDRSPGRRLRVGFVSADLREHPVGRLLRPLFAHRDRGSAELFAYSDVRREDDVTQELRALADHWRKITGASDAAVADLIRSDRIDILVDVSVHTAGNRMVVFARKPAPVQVTMLGLPATTGLATVDYRLTDPYLDPPGVTDGDYTEQSIRLPHCFWVYEAPSEAPAVGALAAERNGFVTFGCLNQFAKVTEPVLELWRTILQTLDDAHLVIQAPAGSPRTALHDFFRQGGIAAERVTFVAKVPRPEYFPRFEDIDLGLDPFPYNGHTSTLDALWMGVPVVTLAGRTAVGRGGASVLSNVGLTELIARTPEEYVAIALRAARDRARLAALRAGLRQRMRASPLMDGKQFTADVEGKLRWMWKRWCES